MNSTIGTALVIEIESYIALVSNCKEQRQIDMEATVAQDEVQQKLAVCHGSMEEDRFILTREK